MCFGSLQGTCRFFQEIKAQLAFSEAIVLAFDSFNTGGLEWLAYPAQAQTLHEILNIVTGCPCHHV